MENKNTPRFRKRGALIQWAVAFAENRGSKINENSNDVESGAEPAVSEPFGDTSSILL